MKYTITLSKEEVKTIIAQYFNDNGADISVNDVALNVDIECVGYGMNEHTEPRFRDCTVNVKLKV